MLKNIFQSLRWNLFWKNFYLPELSLQDLGALENPIELPIQDHLFLPPYYGPSDHDDASALFNLILAYQPGVVLELGTAYGATVANICALSNAKVFTVNALPDQITGKNISRTLDREQIGLVYRKYGFNNRVSQIYANTKNLVVSDYLSPHSVDFAIVDACHDIEYVIGDFYRVLPALHESSIVVFHDVHSSLEGHLISSYLACMYLRRNGFNIGHLTNTWWGIWQANKPYVKFNRSQRFAIIVDKWLAQILMVRYGKMDMSSDAAYFHWIAKKLYAKEKS